jgi:hypothetical protein
MARPGLPAPPSLQVLGAYDDGEARLPAVVAPGFRIDNRELCLEHRKPERRSLAQL